MYIMSWSRADERHSNNYDECVIVMSDVAILRSIITTNNTLWRRFLFPIPSTTIDLLVIGTGLRIVNLVKNLSGVYPKDSRKTVVIFIAVNVRWCQIPVLVWSRVLYKVVCLGVWVTVNISGFCFKKHLIHCSLFHAMAYLLNLFLISTKIRPYLLMERTTYKHRQFHNLVYGRNNNLYN